VKIALINPNRNLKDAAVHLGLGYLSSFAKTQHINLDISILDTRITSRKQAVKYISHKYDLVGITSSTQTFSEAIELASQI